MNGSKDERIDIAVTLVQRNILCPIDYSDSFKVKGEPVLNGMFSVEKTGAPAAGEKRVTQSIMNLVPSNCLQRLRSGEVETFAIPSQWARVQMPEVSALLWSGAIKKLHFTLGHCRLSGEDSWRFVGLFQGGPWENLMSVKCGWLHK